MMTPKREKRSSCWTPALVLSAALMQGLAGCALFPEGDDSGTRLGGDSAGQDMRRNAQAAAEPPAKKEPFWEKYRDKRARDIDQKLGAADPAGW